MNSSSYYVPTNFSGKRSMALIKLTKTQVDNLPLTEGIGKQSFYYDAELKGFGLRVSNKTKTYIVEAKVNAKTVRVTIGKHGVVTAELARKIAREKLSAMCQGVNPNAERREKQIKGVTLKYVYEEYLSSRPTLKATTKRDYKTCVESYLKEWLHKPLIEITRDMIEQKHRVLSLTSESRANLAMRVLRALFNFAVEYRDAKGGAIITENPVKRLSAKKLWNKVERRSNYIQPHQIKSWWDAVMTLTGDGMDRASLERESIRDYLILLLFTGLRREEALSLRWDLNIDLDAKLLKLIDTKNRQDHILPLSTFLYDLLAKRKAKSTSEWVFPGIGKTGRIVEPKKQLLKVTELSGIIFTSHDLRRTFASILNSLPGISYYTIKRLMNHKSADVTAGYIQHSHEILREDMQKVTDYILKITTD